MASMLLTSSLVVKFIMKSSESELVYESSYVLERGDQGGDVPALQDVPYHLLGSQPGWPQPGSILS